MWLTLLFAASGIRGSVTDAKSKEALIEATVKVTAGADKQVLTDVEGNFELELPPGIYDLRIYYDVYSPRRVTGVEIREGEYKTVNVALSADEKAVEEVVVEARADKRNAAALLAERKKSAVVQDAIGSQEIQKTPDVNAGEAVKRVVSATVIDNRYVLIRGIGGRYSQTLLNGAELPSPEPDEPAVPLDLFPTALLSNLTVVKTYQPDLPGTFAGGVGMIETNSYPAKLEVRLQLRAEYNSEATFRMIPTAPGAQDLPNAVPRDKAMSKALSVSERERISEAFPNTWDGSDRTGTPPWALNGQIGNTWTFGNGHKLGLLASASYSHRDLLRVIETNTTQANAGVVVPKDQGTNNLSNDTSTTGGLLNLAYQFSPNHELGLFSLFTHNTENQTQAMDGYSEPLNAPVQGTRFYNVYRQMTFNQLRGFHRVNTLELEWQGNFSFTNRAEPDVRDLQLLNSNGNAYTFREAPNSGERYYSGLTQPQASGFVHFMIPLLDSLKLRFGGRASYTARDFSARRFRFESQPTVNPSSFALPRNELFTPTTIGPDFLMSEFTFSTDAYKASQVVGGAFAMVDYTKEWFRLIGGVRYEGSNQSLTSGTPFATLRENAQDVNRQNHDVLPSANFVFTLAEGMNLRAAYAYTLARPRFRELAPFLFYDFARRRSVTGQPNLQETKIHNADVRWEWFPSELSVFAASVFYKNFQQPIETVVYDPTDGSVTFANTNGAHLVGGELEARTNFGFITPALKPLSLSANFTLIWSQVTLGDEARASTNRQRPLQGQSPYVANVTLGWSQESTGTDFAVLYNVYGPRLVEVGFETLPDLYEQTVNRLDVNFSQQLGGGFGLKLSATNLAYQTITIKQGPIVIQRYQPGVNVLLALEWRLQ